MHSEQRDLSLGIGSVQSIGLRGQPLVRVHLSDTVAINFDASVSERFAQRRLNETYMVGMSVLW